jgi:polyisoprenoid-binding protein YceI
LIDGSLVRFKVDEILYGNPSTVVGESASSGVVEGSISLDYANPAAVTLSPVRVDLISLATDNNFRNRSLHDLILQTGDETNRYAQFNATGFSGLPDSVLIGQTYAFQITGDLTLHGVTKTVTFEAQVTPISDTQLKGAATLTVKYEDFGIQILRLPQQVAAVYKDVILEIEFVAETQ